MLKFKLKVAIMKKIKTTHTNRNLLFVIVTMLLIAVGYLVWSKLEGYWSFTAKNEVPGTLSTVSAEDQKRSNQVDLDKKQEYLKNAKENGATGAVVPIPSSDDTIEISAKKKESVVLITTSLKGYEAGTCKLHVTNGTHTYDNAADIIYQPEFSTCAGFSVPLSNLGMGSWKIDLVATPYNGSSVTKTLIYEVQ